KTLAALDHVISYYNVANDVEHVIKDGPTSGLEVYLESINKIRTSIQYFELNNANSPELHNLLTLFDTAGDTFEKEFRSLLTRYSKPVPAIVIINLVSVDEEMAAFNGKTNVEHLPAKTISELIRISEWLLQNKRDDFMNVYASIRANILLRSLQGLKDHQKSASGSSVSSLPIHSSPALSRSRLKDSTGTKGTKNIPQAIINKASKKIMNFSQSVEQAAGFALGHRKQGSGIDVKDEVIDVDMEYYQMCVSALHKLMQSEMKLMDGIIPAVHRNKVFERIVHPGFDFVVQEGENVASKAKKSVSKHDFIGALGVFPIIKHLITLKPEIEQLLQVLQTIWTFFEWRQVKGKKILRVGNSC
uniref:Exocyst complex component 7 n=1 Tax=Strigamia maritima TaxID=126957 RepID=T1IUD6_STRMM